jgi:methionine salvage enolase-phosphatase E1
MSNQPTWLSFIGKLVEFVRYILFFFKSRKEQELQKEQEEKNKVKKQIEKGYREIDKRSEKKKQDDIQKRLDNLF